MNTNLLKFLAVATVAALPLTGTMAVTASHLTYVKRTMVGAGDAFGGCMVQLVDALPSELDCPDDPWVTFSCIGEHATKSEAMRMLDSAQMAFVTGRPVRVFIDDQRKHGDSQNQFCFVHRIDVLPE